LETQITELNTHQEQLNRNHHQLVEISHVLRFSESTRQQRGGMGQGDEDVIQDDEGTSLITEEGKFQVKFGYARLLLIRLLCLVYFVQFLILICVLRLFVIVVDSLFLFLSLVVYFWLVFASFLFCC
jgi:hypothetical protein